LIVGDCDWLIPNSYSFNLHTLVDGLSADAKNRVSLIPVTDEIFKYYKAADILLCTSRVESFPRIILEAMAFGLPIVTTPVFGIQEQVHEGVNALFYPPGDIDSLVEALEKLIRDRETRIRFSGNSPYVLQQIETFEEMVDRYAAVFAESYFSKGDLPRMPESSAIFRAENGQDGSPIKKVSFLTTYADEFPQRFRVYNMIEGLTMAGIECAVIKDDFPGNIESLLDSDILVVFRTGMSQNVQRIMEGFRRSKIPTVYDIDDLVFEPESADLLYGLSALTDSDKQRSIHNMRLLKEALLACDYATCTTKSLSKRIEALGKICHVIPNAINRKQYDMAK
jgi:hypothetical protein